MSGPVRLRLSGNRADITAVLASLLGLPDFRVTVDDRTYLNRAGGVRVYAEIRNREQEITR